MVGHGQAHLSLGRWLYGLLFVVALPLVLWIVAARVDGVISLAAPPWQGAGFALCVLGAGLMALAMHDLYTRGRGLPMNAYPPEALVTQGVYAWFSHPIYLGAVICSLGASLWAQSGSGLYVITPSLALGCVALVLGYERLALRRLFGAAVDAYQPLFGLPRAADAPAAWVKKGAMVARVFAPWLAAAYLVDSARCGDGCDAGLIVPGQGLAGIVWLLPLGALGAAMLAVRSEARLRSLAIAGSLATAGLLYLQIVGPAYIGSAATTPAVWAMASLIVVGCAFGFRGIWRALQRACEWVANSRRDWLFFEGRFRIISHSIYSFGAGAVAAGVVGYVSGAGFVGPALAVFGLAGAALYAQLSWGSNALLRPFGFWGGGAGTAAGVLVLWIVADVSITQLVVGVALAAPFAQAVGRLRCMVQGCCHGVPTDARFGIRVWQPQSRVCALSGLKGQYILMTQLYSILFNLMLGSLLIALWRWGTVPAALIAAAYLALTSIERFAEDAYRGETQTRVILGLKEPQWIALGGLAAGIACVFLPATVAATDVESVNAELVASALIAGLITAFAMSMDFPKSQARFSRLSG